MLPLVLSGACPLNKFPSMRLLSLLSLLATFFLPFCSSIPAQSTYPDHVGDIKPDNTLDDPSFRVCRSNDIPQYYSVNSGFEGEKPALLRYFSQNYHVEEASKSLNAYITVRFVVNCNGQTGRFRILGMGMDYQPILVPDPISTQLLQLCKALKGWKGGQSEGIPYDYYQYLTFTIQSGEIIRIMP